MLVNIFYSIPRFCHGDSKVMLNQLPTIGRSQGVHKGFGLLSLLGRVKIQVGFPRHKGHGGSGRGGQIQKVQNPVHRGLEMGFVRFIVHVLDLHVTTLGIRQDMIVPLYVTFPFKQARNTVPFQVATGCHGGFDFPLSCVVQSRSISSLAKGLKIARCIIILGVQLWLCIIQGWFFLNLIAAVVALVGLLITSSLFASSFLSKLGVPLSFEKVIHSCHHVVKWIANQVNGLFDNNGVRCTICVLDTGIIQRFLSFFAIKNATHFATFQRHGPEGTVHIKCNPSIGW
mmetsp:Transcript_26974/g.56489  ORF Transcript_26974/g.56489 Transcript_26974/m.56489 type:complete len:286 (+) Transcript_26974:332-1189(+)